MVLVAALLLVLALAASGGSGRKSLKIEDMLPAGYDKMTPPKRDEQPTIVYFHLTIMSIDSIKESSVDYSRDMQVYAENTVSNINLPDSQSTGTFAADVFFAQSWRDHRLVLPTNMTSDYRLLDLDWLGHLWRPDGFFKNAKEVNFQTMTVPNHYVWLYQDLTLLYMVKLTLTLTCAMNFALYPHDTQECKLQIESLSHTTHDLVFAWDAGVPLVVNHDIELPQQMIVSNVTADCTQVYSTGNFTCLEVIFRLKRHLGHYLFHTYIPTCLIVIMSWVSFWIRPDIAPARVTLGVTSLLTLSTQHAKSQDALPPVSYIKAIDIFMSACTLFVFMVLMEYAVICVIMGDEPTQPPNPKKRPFFTNIKMSFTNIKGSGSFSAGNPSRASHTPATTYWLPASHPKHRQAQAILVDRRSRYIFPISFTVLNIIYWIAFWKYL
ncbi:glycine receptor subunit alpha-2 [Procambarus clarkii]|uniref:glycine receptor subunit alpha-2 n=1 Tax=Procambarus clarkii TaxID=6728 RepID=UPI00374418B6